MSQPNTSHRGIALSAWQKKQAAMLYHFTRKDYLRVLHRMVSDLLNGVVDPLLDMAKMQNRDQLLTNKVWGDRNTSNNWANNAWPFLKDLQISLAGDVGRPVAQGYEITAVNFCLRGVDQYSMDWTTPGEEELLDLTLRTISDYARAFDDTVTKYDNRWDDFTFAVTYPTFAAQHQKIPQFKIRDDICGETGQVPPRTGVYICADDPLATLQFAWTENGGAELRVANTFNDLGLAALAAVGGDSLWLDETKMFNFTTSAPYAARFKDDVFLHNEPYPSLAAAAVARVAFTKRAARWFLVELIPGHFEDIDALDQGDVAVAVSRGIAGGDACVEAGFYFTPSVQDSRRYLAQGETAPDFTSQYGTMYWQWDTNQDK